MWFSRTSRLTTFHEKPPLLPAGRQPTEIRGDKKRTVSAIWSEFTLLHQWHFCHFREAISFRGFFSSSLFTFTTWNSLTAGQGDPAATTRDSQGTLWCMGRWNGFQSAHVLKKTRSILESLASFQMIRKILLINLWLNCYLLLQSSVTNLTHYMSNTTSVAVAAVTWCDEFLFSLLQWP